MIHRDRWETVWQHFENSELNVSLKNCVTIERREQKCKKLFDNSSKLSFYCCSAWDKLASCMPWMTLHVHTLRFYLKCFLPQCWIFAMRTREESTEKHGHVTFYFSRGTRAACFDRCVHSDFSGMVALLLACRSHLTCEWTLRPFPKTAHCQR